MKKILLLLIVSIFVSCAIVACADKTDSEQTKQSVDDTVGKTEIQTDAVIPDIPEIVDLDGFTLSVLNYDPSWYDWANTLIFAEELNGEVLNDAMYKRTSMVEELYNAEIIETKVSSTTEKIEKTVLSGEDNYDMAMLFTPHMISNFINGYLTSWSEISEIDLSCECWDSDVSALYNFDGFQAAISGDYSLYDYSTRHCYAVNKTMYKNLGISDNIYELVKSGKWTLDKLYEMGSAAVSDIDGDGKFTKDDRYGITGSITRHYSALLAGSDVKYIDKNPEGKLYFTIPGSEYASNVIQKLVHLNVGNQTYYNGSNDIGKYDYTIFPHRQALFAAAYVNEIALLRDMEDEIGIIPPPKFSEEQTQYYSLVEGGAESVVLKTLSADRYKNVGILLNAFSYYSRINVIPTYIDVILKIKVSRDEESVDMLDIIFNSSFNDLGTGVWSGALKNNYTSSVFLPRSEDVASVTAKCEKAITIQLEEFTESVGKIVK